MILGEVGRLLDMDIAAVLTGCRKALIGTDWNTFFLFIIQGHRNHFSALWGSTSGNVESFWCS